MEPANVNPPPDRDDARLAELLRGSSPTLPDDGFSARVLAALPPPSTPPLSRLRRPLWLGGAVLGTVVALVGSASAPDAADTWPALSAAFTPVGLYLLEPSVLAALAVALGSAAYALWPTLRRSDS